MLSTGTIVSMNGDIAIRYFPIWVLVVSNAVVVCPGPAKIVSVSNGFV